MVTVFCVVVGVGSVFCVDIGIYQTVDHLKKKIKQQKANLIQMDADLLTLYRSKDIRGRWLNASNACMKWLEIGATPNVVACYMEDPLGATWRLSNAKCLGDDFQAAEGDIHVLVALPRDPKLDPQSKTGGERPLDEVVCVVRLWHLWVCFALFLMVIVALDIRPSQN